MSLVNEKYVIVEHQVSNCTAILWEEQVCLQDDDIGDACLVQDQDAEMSLLTGTTSPRVCTYFQSDTIPRLMSNNL